MQRTPLVHCTPSELLNHHALTALTHLLHEAVEQDDAHGAEAARDAEIVALVVVVLRAVRVELNLRRTKKRRGSDLTLQSLGTYEMCVQYAHGMVFLRRTPCCAIQMHGMLNSTGPLWHGYPCVVARA